MSIGYELWRKGQTHAIAPFRQSAEQLITESIRAFSFIIYMELNAKHQKVSCRTETTTTINNHQSKLSAFVCRVRQSSVF